MTNILVNYIYNKNTDTFVLLNNKYVFADMPFAVMDISKSYNEVLVVPINNKNTVVDKQEYLKTNKQFRFLIGENGEIIEHEDGIVVYLPIDTDVSKLRYINNQLMLIDYDEESEENE